jgi:hypothetical protein
MKLLQVTWGSDNGKSLLDRLNPTLEPSRVASLCSVFQAKATEKMALLQVSLERFDSESEKIKRLHKITSSSRAKEYVLGVGARYSAYLALAKKGEV